MEELSRHDASAGWNVHISNVVDIYGAWFPATVGERVFDNPQAIFSGALNPPFAAVPHEQDGQRGFKVSGRAPFASGIQHADWVLSLAALIDEEGAPPAVCFTLLPAKALEIHEGTWDTLGMGGTGSFDIQATDVFVPADQFVPLAPRQSTAEIYAEQQLYRLSIWPLVSALAAPALGVARAAIDDLISLATIKVPFYTQRTLRSRDIVQSQIARAEAKLGAARAYYYTALQEAWDAVELPGSSLSPAHKHKLQLATCYAIEQGAEVVQIVFDLAGSSGFRRGQDPRSSLELRFEKYLREANTMTQHAFGSKSRYESVGQIMLGLESDWPFFAF
jgi:alkylation response protein AidB-like acyl-CoA dehydrogenase